MFKARLGCTRKCFKQPTTTTTKLQSCKTEVNHKPSHTYQCLTHPLYEVCSQATAARNYLFTVVSNNTPHELISLVKLIADLIISKSEGDKGKSEGSYNDSLRNLQQQLISVTFNSYLPSQYCGNNIVTKPVVLM